jgi:hypothetical protein
MKTKFIVLNTLAYFDGSETSSHSFGISYMHDCETCTDESRSSLHTEQQTYAYTYVREMVRRIYLKFYTIIS